MNKVKILAAIFVISAIITGCELFVIGPEIKPKKVINIDQTTALGAIYVFKTELDSNNSPGAAEVIAAPDGKKLLAIERYYMYWEMDRMKRLIADMPVTYVRIDTVEISRHEIEIEFDYLKRYSFTAAQLGDSWYILNYQRKPL